MLFLEFLAVGAWGFWILIAISAIIMSELMDTDNPGWATITAIGTVTILAVMGDFNPLVWLRTNPTEVVFCIIAYFVLGAVWGVIKWYFWLLKARRKLDDIAREHPGLNGVTAYTMLRNAGLSSEFPPKVGDHKTRIMGWMALWPASMVWTVLNDPVRRGFEEIYNRLGGGLQAMSDRVFKDVTLTKN